MTFVLLVLVAAAAGGAVCVVWAERGGPRWVRIVASVTLGIAAVVRGLHRSGRRGGSRSSANSDGDE
ncbi:hypothetical protein [Streptomyces sp. NPDC002209]|uniref:hypothetical protein n=1 Tax=Streptomyces sp. NPDC002209 TaxID=3364638 RepID=UPI00367AE90A